MITLTDMFCGAGGSSTGGIEVPGVEIRTAMNHWDLAIETHNTNHPNARHILADISQTDPRYVPGSDMLWASPECFTAGHLVTTERGQVPIEEVRVGDMALTHNLRWRPVLRVQHRSNAETVIAKGFGHPGIECTPSHRFWLRPSEIVHTHKTHKREYGPSQWMRIDRALPNEALWATPDMRGAKRLQSPDVPDALATLADPWWVIGRWLGDGSVTKGRHTDVSICCAFDEASELELALAGGKRWSRSEKRTATLFTLTDRATRDWMLEQFGAGAANKQLPTWALTLPRVYRQRILDGYMSADGGTTQRRHRCSTVSRALAVSTRLLAESLGHRVAVAIDHRTSYSIEGREGVALPQLILHWEPNLAASRSPEAFTADGMAWSRVRSVVPTGRKTTVYNIEVAEDHSYVLDGIVVKNCTNHSLAKGRKRATMQASLLDEKPLPDEAAERSRATMWDVPRFAEVHHYRSIITENVVDAAKWIMFPAWLHAMDLLGYAHRIVYLNSMHAQVHGLPAPQSRDRMYVVFWRKGDHAPDLDGMQRPKAWCPSCGELVDSIQTWKHPERPWGRYGAQYVYRCPKHSCRGQRVEPGWLPASTIIDWDLPAERIGDRTKPLSAKTMARIEAGLERYGRTAVLIRNASTRAGESPAHLSTPVTEPMRTLLASGIPQSLIVEAAGNTYDAADPHHPMHGRDGGYYRVWPDSDPLRTLHATMSKALLVPVDGQDGKSAAPIDGPLRTQTARNETGLLMPYYGQAATAEPASKPIDTIAANGNHHAIAEMDVPNVEDCRLRMLEPSEIKLGMAFPASYVMLGTKREQVRMSGNAVTPPAARDLIWTVTEPMREAS